MAGGNPTAWRGALRRQASPAAGHGRGPSSGDGGTRARIRRHGRLRGTARRDVRPLRPESAARPSSSAARRDCPRWRWRAATSGTGARRRDSPGAPGGPPTPPLRHGLAPIAPRRHASAVRTTNDSICDWVPSKTAQSVRRSPSKSGPRTRCMASTSGSRPTRSARRSARHRSSRCRAAGVAPHEGGAATRHVPCPAPSDNPSTSSARWRARPPDRAKSPATTRRGARRAGGRRGTPRDRGRPSDERVVGSHEP